MLKPPEEILSAENCAIWLSRARIFISVSYSSLWQLDRAQDFEIYGRDGKNYNRTSDERPCLFFSSLAPIACPAIAEAIVIKIAHFGIPTPFLMKPKYGTVACTIKIQAGENFSVCSLIMPQGMLAAKQCPPTPKSLIGNALGRKAFVVLSWATYKTQQVWLVGKKTWAKKTQDRHQKWHKYNGESL